MKRFQFILEPLPQYKIEATLKRDRRRFSSISRIRSNVSLTFISAIILIFGILMILSVRYTEGCERSCLVENSSLIETTKSIEDTWGVQVKWIWRTAGGYMLDFRFKVINTEKAMPLFDRGTKPYLIDQTSGAKMIVPSPPKVGPLRNSNRPIVDHTYFIFFANPARYIKVGNKVTIVIGDFKVKDLVVQ